MFFFGIEEEGQEVECKAESRQGKASLPGPGIREAKLGGGSCGEERHCGQGQEGLLDKGRQITPTGYLILATISRQLLICFARKQLPPKSQGLTPELGSV